MPDRLSLAELIAVQMNRRDINELINLGEYERRYLAGVLSQLRADLPSLTEWNRVIRLLGAGPAAESQLAAKQQILEYLNGAAHDGKEAV